MVSPKTESTSAPTTTWMRAMGKPTEKAWKMLTEGQDPKMVNQATGLSQAVLDAMLKDIRRQQRRHIQYPES